jgi:hypothetical protein
MKREEESEQGRKEREDEVEEGKRKVNTNGKLAWTLESGNCQLRGWNVNQRIQSRRESPSCGHIQL